MKKILILVINTLLFTYLCLAQTGTWTQVKDTCPHYNNGVCLLMTDGTVICKNSNGPGNGTGWDRLTPDIHGSYINGKWDTISSMHLDRLFFSTQVLPNGNVYAAGGEYGAGDTAGEVYNPLTNIWTMCGRIPSGWNIYDGNSEILYNGNILEGPQIGPQYSYNILQWSPITYQYTVEPNSIYNHDEAEWVKLKDSTVIFVGISSNSSNRYFPLTNTWANDGTLPVNLWDGLSESGSGLMLPNGNVVFFGATPHNAIYSPSNNSSAGIFFAAADFPVINGDSMGQSDASAAMMVNGHILCAVAPVYTTVAFPPPAYFVEYDYTTNTFQHVTARIPGMGGDSIPVASFQTQMLDLPDGNVLVSVSQASSSNIYYVYTPGSGPIPQGKPTINSILPDSCPNYKITGKLFNGISEGAAYGDDWQMSTNYPLVRLINGTDVYYARTSNWNRIGAVQTDSLEDTAVFTLPPNLPNGTYSLVVVVNGFASNPVPFTTFGLSTTENNIRCVGDKGTATALASGGFSPYTYSWSLGGSTKSSISDLSAGTYTIIMMDRNGCTATAAITITQPATALLVTTDSINVSSSGGCDGEAWVKATGGTSPYTYLWTAGQTTDTIKGLCAGMYCCVVTDNNGCTENSCVNVVTGINELPVGGGQWSVYPNPSNGIFTMVGTQNFVSGQWSVEVYNVLGEKVFSQFTIHNSQFTIDLRSKSCGVYFYRIINEDGSLLSDGKMVIER